MRLTVGQSSAGSQRPSPSFCPAKRPSSRLTSSAKLGGKSEARLVNPLCFESGADQTVCTLSTSGTILLSYGFTARPVVSETNVFHTRQLFVDVSFSVHRALVVKALDVLRLRALPEDAAQAGHGRTASVVQLGRRGAALDKRLEDRLREVEEGEECLVVVDVTNEYGKPFEAKFERTQDGKFCLAAWSPRGTGAALSVDRGGLVSADDYFQVRQRLEPGATVRMLVPVDRIRLSREDVERPIPSLSERQFVVAKVKQSEGEERRVRELFWYREALVKRIQAHWNEVRLSGPGRCNNTG